jgi:hypothetical protein
VKQAALEIETAIGGDNHPLRQYQSRTDHSIYAARVFGNIIRNNDPVNRLMDENGILQPGCGIMQKSFFKLDKRLEF